jgi:hypothetical protein
MNTSHINNYTNSSMNNNNVLNPTSVNLNNMTNTTSSSTNNNKFSLNLSAVRKVSVQNKYLPNSGRESRAKETSF